MATERKTSKSSKKPSKLKNLSAAVSSKKATAVKGGSGRRDRLAANHNQTLRTR
jgi:hypothetical protein